MPPHEPVEQDAETLGLPLFTVTVYAASSYMVPEVYKQAARQLGRVIAKEGWRQLNGGGASGLMGAATEGGLEEGGVVDAVILDMFTGCNQHVGLRNVEVCNNMPDRRKGLYDGADAFIALPGGMGTLEEISEIMSWRQLQFHTKAVVLLNTNGFYTKLNEFLERAMEECFISSEFKMTFAVCDTPEEAVAYIKAYQPVTIDKQRIFDGSLAAGKVSDWAAAAAYQTTQGPTNAD
eukprot:comp19905_c0_seq1/m.24132 comp19905_c0_seq1/g.24132  ORF comp19905_c0_seq1/g.24132 comp19905_c0_seq1/m.24132 type:complete len:235 (-) comp19905_c0_seq1:18-722(-)